MQSVSHPRGRLFCCASPPHVALGARIAFDHSASNRLSLIIANTWRIGTMLDAYEEDIERLVKNLERSWKKRPDEPRPRRPPGFWTEARCISAVRNCDTRTEFHKRFPGATEAARAGGFYARIIAHMPNMTGRNSSVWKKGCPSPNPSGRAKLQHED